jgi:hypothetical protein
MDLRSAGPSSFLHIVHLQLYYWYVALESVKIYTAISDGIIHLYDTEISYMILIRQRHSVAS